MNSLELLPIFLSGIFVFFAPCTLPLIPAYLGLITGNSLSDIDEKKGSFIKTLKNALMFILGFSLIFVLFGILTEMISGFYGMRVAISRLSGVLVILFALSMIGLFKFKLFSNTLKFKLPSFIKPGEPFSSFVIGLIFATGWSPCVGPVLIAVLGWVSNSSTLLQGIIGMIIFSLGLAIPFIITALAAGSVLPLLKKLNKYMNIINIIGGLILLYIGILLIFNQFSLINTQGFKLLEFFNIDYFLIEGFL